jgi:hypothetical protein
MAETWRQEAQPYSSTGWQPGALETLLIAARHVRRAAQMFLLTDD